MRSRHKDITDRVRRRRQRAETRGERWAAYLNWLARRHGHDSEQAREYYRRHVARCRGKLVVA